MDSFDPALFRSCYVAVLTKLPPKNDSETKFYASFEAMMEDIDILVQKKLIRKDSIDSTGASMEI